MMIPKYIVFLVLDKHKMAKPIASGNNLADLLSVYRGYNYKIMPIGSWTE